MIGFDAPYAEVPWFWSDQFERTSRWSARPRPDATVHWRGDADGGRTMAFAFESGQLRYAAAFNMGGEIRFARKLIERGVTLAPDLLCDPARKLREIAGAATAAA